MARYAAIRFPYLQEAILAEEQGTPCETDIFYRNRSISEAGIERFILSDRNQ